MLVMSALGKWSRKSRGSRLPSTALRSGGQPGKVRLCHTHIPTTTTKHMTTSQGVQMLNSWPPCYLLILFNPANISEVVNQRWFPPVAEQRVRGLHMDPTITLHVGWDCPWRHSRKAFSEVGGIIQTPGTSGSQEEKELQLKSETRMRGTGVCGGRAGKSGVEL